MPEPKRPLKVFLCHAHADRDAVRALYARLTQDGMDAWLDTEKLLPGQDWELEIHKAVYEADVFVVCLSRQFSQTGFRTKEVRLALDIAQDQPEGKIFIIPARLEECENLGSLRKWHWVNLFEADGYEKLTYALLKYSQAKGAILDINKTLLEESDLLSTGAAGDFKRPLRVFLCYAHYDKTSVINLYNRLTLDGMDVWLDEKKLLPGADWELQIRNAIRDSDVVIVCQSERFNQAGFRQKEVRLALETAMEYPEGKIFIIPLRLESCSLLESLLRWHQVDLFDEKGYESLLRSLRMRGKEIKNDLKDIEDGTSKFESSSVSSILVESLRDSEPIDTIKPPKVFISYAWEDDIKKWVTDFAAQLRFDGVETILDQWEVVPGDRLSGFMEKSIRESDFVIVICTPKYKRKSDQRLGGVGYEGDIITSELLTEKNDRKFVPVLFKGPWNVAAPSWALGKYYIALEGDFSPNENYFDLLRTLHRRWKAPPPIGNLPTSLSES